eukprot:6356973-Amphidinium_carterae.1
MRMSPSCIAAMASSYATGTRSDHLSGVSQSNDCHHIVRRMLASAQGGLPMRRAGRQAAARHA